MCRNVLNLSLVSTIPILQMVKEQVKRFTMGCLSGSNSWDCPRDLLRMESCSKSCEMVSKNSSIFSKSSDTLTKDPKSQPKALTASVVGVTAGTACIFFGFVKHGSRENYLRESNVPQKQCLLQSQ